MAFVFSVSVPLLLTASPFAGRTAGAYRSLRGGPLPVVLVGFIAVPNADKTVTVNWSTQQEINSSLFTIERSADANNWDAIGTVTAKGFSTQVSNYSFTDVSSLNGITYYRLRITNKDGDFGYTQIEIARISLPTQYLLFPTPAKDYINISVREAAPVSLNVRLISLSGRLLQQNKIEAGKGMTVSMSVASYPNGMYILQITGSNGTFQTSKFLIAR